jgi:ABC-type transport system substrate-binding protein
VVSARPPAPVALAAALAIAIGTACRPPDDVPRIRAGVRATPRDGGTLRLAFNQGLATLDPSVANDDVSAAILAPLYDTLLAFEPMDPDRPDAPGAGLRLVPQLAERWEVSADGLRYRFVLRADATYRDGTPIVAADLRFALERALRRPDSPFAAFLADLVGADAVIAGAAPTCAGLATPDPRTLELTLARPNPALPQILTMKFATPIRADAPPDQTGDAPLTSGPFEVARWDHGVAITLRRNPHYRDAGRAHLDQLVLLEQVPRDTAFLMFLRGELEACAPLTAPDLQWLLAQPAWRPQLRRGHGMNAFGARMNVRVPPFDDRRVRQALNLAIDKDHLRRVLGGDATIAHGILPPGLLGRDDALAPYPHDPARARALLGAAGYPRGLDLTFATFTDDEAERVAASMVADLAVVGVRVRIETMAMAPWQEAIRLPDGPPFSIATWTEDYPDPTSFLDVRFHGRAISAEGSSNDSFFADPALDDLLDRARGELDVDRRVALYHQAERLLFDAAPWIWGYHRDQVEVVQPTVRGYAPHPVWGRDFTTAWLDPAEDAP